MQVKRVVQEDGKVFAELKIPDTSIQRFGKVIMASHADQTFSLIEKHRLFIG